MKAVSNDFFDIWGRTGTIVMDYASLASGIASVIATIILTAKHSNLLCQKRYIFRTVIALTKRQGAEALCTGPIGQRNPDALPQPEHRRGLEKRCILLSYLCHHPEELRPTNAAA